MAARCASAGEGRVVLPADDRWDWARGDPVRTALWVRVLVTLCIALAASDLLATSTLETEVEALVKKSAGGFRIARNTLYVIAAFGMLGVGAAAYFGRMNWKWAWHIIGGCALIGTSGLLVDLLFDTSEGLGGDAVTATDFGETGFQ